MLVLAWLFYLSKRFLPVDLLKLGLSMMQIVASGSTVYDVPWPPAFHQFISSLRVFLVDLISITKASCTHSLTFYDSMVVVFVALKLALVLLLGLPYIWGKLFRSVGNVRVVRRLRARSIQRRLSIMEDRMQQQGQRRGSAARELQRQLAAMHNDSEWASVDWIKVFKSSFMLLFVAYPGVALNVMRVFHCKDVDEQSFLVADMRLQCYTAQWAG